MTAALGWTEADLPVVQCADLTAYEANLKGKMVFAVFASYYLENPASAFGHVMLGFADDAHSALGGYSASFETDATGMSTIGYLRRGLFGGLRAVYHVAPFYERAGRYERHELRDLWLFPLRLRDSEVKQLARHLWELRDANFAYGFFQDNCAQKILAVVNAVAPSYGLLPYSRAAVLPAEVVRRLVAKIGLGGSPVWRPSLIEHYEGQVSRLSAQERAQLRGMIAARTVHSNASVAVLDAALTWSELKTPSRAFQRQSELTDSPEVAWRRSLWLSLSRSGRLTETTDTVTAGTTSHSLLSSHRPRSVALRSGVRAGDGTVQGVGIRWLLHDVLDPEAGYPPQSSVVAGQMELSVSGTGRGRIDIDRLTVLRVERLGSALDFRPGLAWRLDVGTRRLPMRGRSPVHTGLELDVGSGVGASRGNLAAVAYTLVGLRPGFFSAGSGHAFASEAIWSAGLQMRFPRDLRAQIAVEEAIGIGVPHDRGLGIGATLRMPLARSWEVEARFNHLPRFRELTVGVVAFF